MSKRAIIVTGDRNAQFDKWRGKMLAVLDAVHYYGNANANTVLIHGGASGIDTIAHVVWNENWGDEHIREYGAPWIECELAYGNRNMAGPLRNALMLTELEFVRDLGYDVQVIAFHDALWSGSKGTRGMVKLAQARGIKTRIITSHGGPTR